MNGIPVEAIQQVMEEVEHKQFDHDHKYRSREAKYDMQYGAFHDGAGEGLEFALEKLREVIAQYAPDNSNRADGDGTDDCRDGQTNQVQAVRSRR